VTTLREIQPKWIQKFYEIRQEFGDSPPLAAPFLSVSDPRDEPTGIGPILMIGKATAGDWGLDPFLLNEGQSFERQADERRAATLKHLSYRRNHQTSAFWRFWKTLHEIGSPVVWTNLVKIGVKHGNPGRKYIKAQSCLACATLRAEVDEYKPSLIVIAADYAKEQITYPVFGDRPNWKEPPGYEFCWIERSASSPAILWTDHPQMKGKVALSSWMKKARELTAQAN